MNENEFFFTPEERARWEAGPAWPPGALTPSMILEMDPDAMGPTWLVPGVIPVGLSLLVAPPKTGKSIFATQLARSVAYGLPFLGRGPSVTGPVVVLSLDEPQKLIVKRVHVQGWTPGENVAFFSEWTGGLPGLREAIQAVRPALVIIDTIGRFLGNVGVDFSKYEEVTHWDGQLHHITMESAVSVLQVHHTKKNVAVDGPDPFRDALGSQAFGGIADAVLGIYRPRAVNTGWLIGGGRFGEDFKIPIALDPDTLTWREMSPFEIEAMESTELSPRERILRALPDDGEATTGQVAESAGVDTSNALKVLERLFAQGLVDSRKNGRTRLWTRKNSKSENLDGFGEHAKA